MGGAHWTPRTKAQRPAGEESAGPVSGGRAGRACEQGTRAMQPEAHGRGAALRAEEHTNRSLPSAPLRELGPQGHLRRCSEL